MSLGRLVPWLDWAEWRTVGDQLFAAEDSERDLGVARVGTGELISVTMWSWKARWRQLLTAVHTHTPDALTAHPSPSPGRGMEGARAGPPGCRLHRQSRGDSAHVRCWMVCRSGKKYTFLCLCGGFVEDLDARTSNLTPCAFQGMCSPCTIPSLGPLLPPFQRLPAPPPAAGTRAARALTPPCAPSSA